MPRRTSKKSIKSTPPAPVFLVTFEHAQRSFKCVLLDWEKPDGNVAKQWVVTMAGRPVWSFESTGADTHDSVQEEVTRWWDETHAAR